MDSGSFLGFSTTGHKKEKVMIEGLLENESVTVNTLETKCFSLFGREGPYVQSKRQ